LVDPPEIEIVLDEAQDGGLVRHRFKGMLNRSDSSMAIS
jgi:hypothetical protein